MRTYIKISTLITICSLALFTACKQDDTDLLNGSEDIYSGIYMPQAVITPKAFAYTISAVPETIIYGANFGGPVTNSETINVSFQADPSLVSAYNTAHYTNYALLPEGSYMLEQENSLIPLGKLATPPLKLSVYTDKLDGVGGYLLPVTVKTTSSKYTVKEALKTTYFLVSASYLSNPFTNFDRTNWVITGFSSQEAVGEGANNGRAIFAIDGVVATYWTTDWKTTRPGPPHYITMDMNKTQRIHGFQISPRMLWGAPRDTGNAKDIVVQTGNDGVNWLYSQSFSLKNLEDETIYLDYFQTARYFKITINSSNKDNFQTTIAEINAF